MAQAVEGKGLTAWACPLVAQESLSPQALPAICSALYPISGCCGWVCTIGGKTTAPLPESLESPKSGDFL